MRPFEITGLPLAAHNPEPDKLAIYDLGDGQALVIELPPLRSDGQIPRASFEAMGALHPVTVELARIDAERRKLAADPDWTDEGKSKRLALLAEPAEAALEDAERRVTALEADASRVESEVYAPPKLDAGDAVGALADREVRDWLQRLTPEALSAVKLTPEMLGAVMRSPVPLNPALLEMARPVWVEHVNISNPDAAQKVSEAKAAASWARRQLPQFKAPIGRAKKAF